MFSFRDLRPRLRWVEASLWPILIANGLLLVTYVMAVLLHAGLAPDALQVRWGLLERSTNGLILCLSPFGLAAIVTFIRWQRHAVRNLYVITDQPVKYDVGWATWGWLLPFANLVVPMRHFHELAEKSSGARAEASLASLVNLWWCLFLGSRLLDQLSGLLAESDQTKELILSLGVGILAAGMNILAGLFVIVLLRRLTDRQEATWAELNPA